VLTAILLWRSRENWDAPRQRNDKSPPASTNAEAQDRVSLTIDYGNDRRQDFDSVAWHEGITVADLLKSAPDLGITQKGTGQGAFLTAINGVANEGAEGKNWTYEVNGKSGDRSFAVYELRPGDRVLWTFGPPR
jgi:hypothetical protein